MPDRIRVLWVAKGLGPGGMEQLLVNHARAGDREHLEYHAAYVIERPNSVVPDLRDAGVSCHAIGGADPRDPRWVSRLARLVADERIDVVHVHSPSVAAGARVALRARRHRPAIVYTEHNSAESYRRPTRWANWSTYPLDDARFAVSTAARDAVPKRLGRRSEVLVHGVDVAGIAALSSQRGEVRAELGVGPDERLVGIVANLRVNKAYPVLLQAARQVVDLDPSVRFVSLGQGPLEAELLAERDRLGLRGSFEFLGFRADVKRMMAGFDVFTLSSDIEGLPVSVMEAKALGLPVVATAVGGLTEMVTDGVDGRLVPRRRPDALAAALIEVLDDADLRVRLGAASALGASDYDAAVAVSHQDEVYRRLGAGRR